MDNRGVSEVIGFTLIFALIIVLFSLYQAQIIPNQNAQVEFRHSQDVQQDLTELRANILTTASDDTESTITVALGTQFPSRIVGINPPPPAGSLRTVNLSGEAILEVTNAEAVDTETADYWNGNSREYTTRGVKYTPLYSEYDNAPATVYENSVLYNNLSTAGETRYAGLSEQQVVSSREIDLTALQGDIDRSGSMSMSVTATSPAGETETIAVERQTSGNPVTVQFPSELSAANWTALLRDERAANGGYITAISKSGGRVRLEFKETGGAGAPITYELQTSAVGVGTGITNPPAVYVVPTSSTNADVTPGETTEFVVEVRNGFNGPESNVSLSASASSGAASVSSRTNVEGQVTVDYTAPSSGSDTVTVEDDLDNSGTIEADEQVQFSVTVETGGGNGGSNSESVSYESGTASSSNGNEFKFNLDTGGSSVTIQNASVDTSTIGDVRSDLQSIEVDGTNERTNGDKYSSDGTREPLDNPTVSGTPTIVFGNFNAGSRGSKLPTGSYSSSDSEPTSGDYLTVTVGFTDGSESTFYFTPP